MKKSRILAVAGVALLATGVLAACGSSKSSNDAEAPKLTVIHIPLIQKLWIILSLVNKVQKWLLQMVLMAYLQMINMGTLHQQLQKTGLYHKMV